MVWHRHTIRNPLLNLRLTSGVVPILSESLGDMEDALASGVGFASLVMVN